MWRNDALEWQDVDLHKRQLCVQRCDWKGHVTVPKGGRLRYVPLTIRLTTAFASTGTCDRTVCCVSRMDRRCRPTS
jgi:hypothetical protein